MLEIMGLENRFPLRNHMFPCEGYFDGCIFCLYVQCYHERKVNVSLLSVLEKELYSDGYFPVFILFLGETLGLPFQLVH